MTPEQIEQMRADMEAGTPGPWSANIDGTGDWFVSGGNHRPVCEVGADGEGPTEEDARRIARVPQLEAEVLRLREAIEAAEKQLRASRYHNAEHYRARDILNAAIGGTAE